MSWLNDIAGSAIVQSLGWTLFHSLWQGAVIAIVLAFVLTLLHAKSANARYVAGCIALAASALCPLATFTWLYTAHGEQASSSASATIAAPSKSNGIPQDATANHHNAEPSPTSRPMPLPWSRSILAVLVGAWICGVMYHGLQLLDKWLKEERCRHFGIEPADAALSDMCAKLAERLRVRQTVSVLLSSTVSVPMIIGWLRPSLLLPVTFITNLEPSDIEALMAHELAHVRRHDYLANIVQSVIDTLLFYHPAIRWISRRVRVEREYCCDDIAVQLDDSTRYARALSHLVELRFEQFHVALGAGGTSLHARVARLSPAYIPPASTSHRKIIFATGFATLVAALITLWNTTYFFAGGRASNVASLVPTFDTKHLPQVVVSPAPVPFLQLPRSETNPQEILWDGQQILKFSDSVPPGVRSKSVWVRTPVLDPLQIIVIPAVQSPHSSLVVEWKTPSGTVTSDSDSGSGRGGRLQILLSDRSPNEPIRLNMFPHSTHDFDGPTGGDYIVCVRRLRDVNDIDPETIGVESSLVVLDDSGQAVLPNLKRDAGGVPIVEHLRIDYPGDIDVFELPSSLKEDLKLRLNYTSIDRPHSVAIYDSRNHLLTALPVDSEHSLSITPMSRVPRYLHITGTKRAPYSVIITSD